MPMLVKARVDIPTTGSFSSSSLQGFISAEEGTYHDLSVKDFRAAREATLWDKETTYLCTITSAPGTP